MTALAKLHDEYSGMLEVGGVCWGRESKRKSSFSILRGIDNDKNGKIQKCNILVSRCLWEGKHWHEAGRQPLFLIKTF